MKTDKNFRLPKYYKAILGSITDPKLRSLWKKSFIESLATERVKTKGE